MGDFIMTQNRRDFIRSVAGAGSLLGIGVLSSAFQIEEEENIKVVILHTNDVHSHIDPFPDNDPKYPGLGGVERRAALINKIRATEKNVLLLDAGDIFQGTPYFNMYAGEIEMKLMTKMGYDASAIGNHDFDLGIENLAKQLQHASFPMICANYDFTGTAMEGKTIPYKIFEKGGVRIGVFGLGIELEGLVGSNMYGKTIYIDPLIKAAEMSHLLKKEKKCDVVICLSHLGYRYENDKVSDYVLAKKSMGIDIIIGAHTHTFLDKPTIVKNREDKEVYVTQVGWAGIRLGKITISTNKKTRITTMDAHTINVSNKFDRVG
jgi:5'-nucleotidase